MLHILDLQENRSVIVIVHSKSFLGRKKKKSKLTVALIPKKTLPSAGFSRQCDSSKQPGHPVPGQPAAVHVDPSPSSAAGVIAFQRLWRCLHLAPFPLKQKLFSLTTVHHICNSLLIKARSTFRAERKSRTPSLGVSFLPEGAGLAVPAGLAGALVQLAPPPPRSAPPPGSWGSKACVRKPRALGYRCRANASWP